MLELGRTYEQALVEKVIMGDRTAFREIFYRYKDKLFSYCCRFTKCEEAAEEIVHDVLLKVWMTRKQINPELSFSSYLYTITRNHTLNFLRKAAADTSLRKKLSALAERHHCQPEDSLTYNSLSAVADDAIARLPPQRQLVYRLSRHEAMSHEEIAARLHISRNTVRNHITAALRTIRDYLNVHAGMSICLVNALLLFAG